MGLITFTSSLKVLSAGGVGASSKRVPFSNACASTDIDQGTLMSCAQQRMTGTYPRDTRV